MSNIFFLKYFVINYVLNFMYIYNAQLKVSPNWKYYDFAHAINCTCKLTWVCACACTCDCMRLKEHYIDFWKVIYENVGGKNHSFHNKHIYIIRVTDILKFYEVLFCTYRKGLFCLQKQSLCLYSSVYVWNTPNIKKWERTIAN